MNINKTIHEALGLCWHEPDGSGEKVWPSGTLICGCGLVLYANVENPDYTAPVHYCALMDWMRGKVWDVKVTGLSIFEQDKYTFDIADWFELTRQSQVDLIAEAIEAGVLS